MSEFSTSPASAPVGLHTYSFAALKRAARHAMAREPDDDLELGEVVNDALQFLTDLHPWSWRVRRVTLALPQSDDPRERILLPADFLAMEHLYITGSHGQAVPRTLDEIERWRAGNPGAVPVFSGTYYAINWLPQTEAGSPQRAAIEIHPAVKAGEAVADFARLTYRRSVPKLTEEAHVADLPAPYHGLLRRLVRAMALSDTENRAGEDWRIFERMLPVYIESDGLLQQSLGPIRGALMSRPDELPAQISLPDPE